MSSTMRFHAPAIVWSLLIAIGLLTPGPGNKTFGENFDWVAGVVHLLLFLVLGFLLARSLTGAGASRSGFVAFAVSSIYGALLEFVQIPIPGRGFEWADILMNNLGALIGAALAGYLTRRSRPS